MGQSFFFRTRGTSTAWAWLFAACVLLYLRPGDSLQCKHCASWNPGEPCNPSETTCNSLGDTAVCMTSTIYVEDRLDKKFMGCFDDNGEEKACGRTGTFPEINLRYENNCCSEGDFCNNEL